MLQNSITPRPSGLLGFLEDNGLSPRRIETCGHFRIARRIACKSQLPAFNPVDGMNSQAYDPGIGTFKNGADELLRIRVLSKCENPFAPVVSLRAVKIESISRKCDIRFAFRFMALMITSPCSLNISRV